MRATIERNYTEPGDMTSQKKTEFLASNNLMALFFKMLIVTGFYECMVLPPSKRSGARMTKKRTRYTVTMVLVVCLLVNCFGISTISDLQTDFVHPAAVSNLNYILHSQLTACPNYQTVNNVLSGIEDCGLIQDISQRFFRKLLRAKRFRRYKIKWGIPVILDATDYAFFRSRHCDRDLTCTFKKGTPEEKTYYFHKALVARAYLTSHLSIPIAIEFIENDGSQSKQDCENKSADRLLSGLKKTFPKQRFIIQGDALYANRKFMELCTHNKWDYVFTFKAGAQPTLYEEFEVQRDKLGLPFLRVSYGNEQGELCWANEMEKIMGVSFPVNILQYKVKIPCTKGKGKHKAQQSVRMRQKDLTREMAEYSSNHEQYDIDRRKDHLERREKLQKKAEEREQASKEAKEKVISANQGMKDALADADVTVTMADQSGKLQEGDTVVATFTYLTSIKINQRNACDLLVRGRSRWMILFTALPFSHLSKKVRKD